VKPYSFSFDVRHGPMLAVEISALLDDPGASRDTVHAKALIDTGADATMIRPRIAKALKLRSHASEELKIALQKTGRSGLVHFVNILLPGLRSFDDVRVLSGDWTGPEEVLIGRDILEHLVMHYDGPSGSVTLSVRR
jgi:predicted aspartyl protease